MARTVGTPGGEDGGSSVGMPDDGLPLCVGLEGIVLFGIGEAVGPGPGGGGGPPKVTLKMNTRLLPTESAAIVLPFELELVRTNRDTGAALVAEDGYVATPDGWVAYNGAGWCEPATDLLSFTRDGTGFTLAIEWDPDGGGYAADQPTGGRRATSQQLLGMRGENPGGATTGTRLQIANPTASPYQLQFVQTGGQTFNVASVSDGAGGVLVVVFRRAAGRLQARVFRDGVLLGVASLEPSLVDVAMLVFGDAVQSDGAMRGVALWSRPLSDADVARLGDDLSQLQGCEGVGGPVPPFLARNGEVLLNPRYTVPRQDMQTLLVAQGVQRHVRAPSEVVPRRYTLKWEEDDGRDLARVLQAVDMSKGGCVPVQWRHPTDDPMLPAVLCPRWWIVNANELQQLEVERRAGGHVARFELELEEVI